MLIILLGNGLIFLIAAYWRRKKRVVLPIAVLGLFGALSASLQSTLLSRSMAPYGKPAGVTNDYTAGYFAAVEKVKRGDVPFALIYLNMMMICFVVVASRSSIANADERTVHPTDYREAKRH